MNLQKSGPVGEGGKEGGRVIVLSIVSYLLTEGVVGTVVTELTGQGLSPALTIVVTGIILAALRGFSEWMHEEGKDRFDPTMVRGLTRF